jgi:hypothetical protein
MTKEQDKLALKEKENLLKGLANILNSSGFQVRREKLKQGHGWRAVSGSCRVIQNKLIFLDRRLPQDEQIEFLVDRITENGIQISSDQRGLLPESILKRVSVG